MTKLWARHKQVSLKPMHKDEVQSVTLTFDKAIWFPFMTYRFVVIIICANLFPNPTMHDKVMGQTQTGFTEAYAQSFRAQCDVTFDLVLVWDTSSCQNDHLSQIIFKSHHARQSY